MLKRYQLLLNDWLADHIKKMAKRYGTSFSELLRAIAYLEYISLIEIEYPQYKDKLDKELLNKQIKSGNLDAMGKEQFRLSISKLNFEARKAIDFFNTQEAKKAKVKERSKN